MATHRSLLVLGMLVGCGGGTPDRVPDAGMDAAPAEDMPVGQSGSRLKRRGHDLDGTKALDRIFDSARNEGCAAKGWADGNRYCTPSDNTGYVVFTNASCTAKVGLAASGCEPTGPDYYVELEGTECGEDIVTKLHSRGSVRAATPYYRLLPDGSCYGPTTLAPEQKLFTLGPEVPTSALARVTESVAPGAHRFRHSMIESEDGLRFMTRFRDTALDGECWLLASDPEDKSWTCIPGYAASAHHYADASCTTHAATWYSTCPLPKYVMHNDKLSCSLPSYSVYETGPELTVAHEDVGGTCATSELGAGVRVVAAGAPVELATATRTLAGGSTRMKRVNATAEGEALWTNMLRDEQQQIDCVLAKATDGVTRCLPIRNFVQHYFRDAACTMPIDIIRVYHGLAECDVQPKPMFANNSVVATSSCDVRQQIHLVGAEVTATLYANYGACQAITHPNATYYEIGAIVPPEDFAAALPITEQ